MENKMQIIGLLVTVILLLFWQWRDYSDRVSFGPITTSQINAKQNFELSKKTDAVILLSMTRSGSSILGSIFNERENVLYLYEPLYPFGQQECDDKTREQSMEVLKHTASCHFEKLAGLYQSSTRDDFDAG